MAPRAAQQRDALKQRVGPRRILFRHDAAADRDGALRDVAAADLARRLRRRGDVRSDSGGDVADEAALVERQLGRDRRAG